MVRPPNQLFKKFFWSFFSQSIYSFKIDENFGAVIMVEIHFS